MHINAGFAKVHNAGLLGWCSGDALRKNLGNSIHYAVWPWISDLIMNFPMMLQVVAVTILFVEIPLSFLVILGSPWQDFNSGRLGYTRRLWVGLVLVLHFAGFLLLCACETLYIHALILLVIDPFAWSIELFAPKPGTLQELATGVCDPSKTPSSKSVEERMMKDNNKWVAGATKWLSRNTLWIENRLASLMNRKSPGEPGADQDVSANGGAGLGHDFPTNDVESDDDLKKLSQDGIGRNWSLLDWLLQRTERNASNLDHLSWLDLGKSRGLDELKYPPGYAEQETAIGRTLDLLGWNPIAWDARARYADRQIELEQQRVKPADLGGELVRQSQDRKEDRLTVPSDGHKGTASEELAEGDACESIKEWLPSKAQASLGLMTFILLSTALLWLLTGLVLSNACKDPRFPFSSMSMYSVDTAISATACAHPY